MCFIDPLTLMCCMYVCNCVVEVKINQLRVQTDNLITEKGKYFLKLLNPNRYVKSNCYDVNNTKVGRRVGGWWNEVRDKFSREA